MRAVAGADAAQLDERRASAVPAAHRVGSDGAEVGVVHRAGRPGSRPACPPAAPGRSRGRGRGRRTRMTRCTSCSTSTTAIPSAGQLAQQTSERLGLGLVQARGRLVEQQHPRVGGQRPGQLDEPGLAGGQLVGPDVGHGGQRRPGPAPRRPSDRGGRRAARRRPARRSPARSGAPNSSRRWNVRARPRRARRYGAAGDVVAVEPHPAALRAPAARVIDVEQRGLAGAVGPDEPGDLARRRRRGARRRGRRGRRSARSRPLTSSIGGRHRAAPAGASRPRPGRARRLVRGERPLDAGPLERHVVGRGRRAQPRPRPARARRRRAARTGRPARRPPAPPPARRRTRRRR